MQLQPRFSLTAENNDCKFSGITVTIYTDWLSYSFFIQLDTEIGHFGDVLPTQSLGTELKKLNLVQLKQTTPKTK